MRRMLRGIYTEHGYWKIIKKTPDNKSGVFMSIFHRYVLTHLRQVSRFRYFILLAERSIRRLHRQVFFDLISLRSFDNEKPFESHTHAKQFACSHFHITKMTIQMVIFVICGERRVRTKPRQAL